MAGNSFFWTRAPKGALFPTPFFLQNPKGGKGGTSWAEVLCSGIGGGGELVAKADRSTAVSPTGHRDGEWHSNQPNHKATGSPPGLLARASGGQLGWGRED